MYGSYHCILRVRFLTKIVKYIVSPIYKFLKWNCWHFLWNEMIFQLLVFRYFITLRNEMTSFLHSSFVSFHDSWLGYRLVTCHEMKLKTREEMMSFHSTKWWNNSRLVMKYHFIPQKMSAIVHFTHFKKLDHKSTIYSIENITLGIIGLYCLFC